MNDAEAAALHEKVKEDLKLQAEQLQKREQEEQAGSRERERADRQRPAEVGDLGRRLLSEQQSVLRRFSPRRNRWPELRQFDDQVQEFEQRLGAVDAELRELEQRKAGAPADYAEQLAAWQLKGQKGARPEPRLKAIEQELEDRRADREGIVRAIEQVLDDKTRYVAKHRPRLVQEADRLTKEAHARAHELVDELQAARQELIELREAAVWAAVFPHEVATHAIPHNLLAAGMRRPVRDTLGLDSQLQFEQVREALRRDLDLLRGAATREQRTVIEGIDPRRRAFLEAHDGTPEGRELERREKAEALRRHRELWGTEPA